MFRCFLVRKKFCGLPRIMHYHLTVRVTVYSLNLVKWNFRKGLSPWSAGLKRESLQTELVFLPRQSRANTAYLLPVVNLTQVFFWQVRIEMCGPIWNSRRISGITLPWSTRVSHWLCMLTESYKVGSPQNCLWSEKKIGFHSLWVLIQIFVVEQIHFLMVKLTRYGSQRVRVMKNRLSRGDDWHQIKTQWFFLIVINRLVHF